MPTVDRSFPTELHALYSHHHGWLYTWLRKKLRNGCDAADLAQDTFVRVLVGQKFSALQSEPRALLTHIAKGLVIDHWRRQDVERAYLDSLAAMPANVVPSPETCLLILEALQRIEVMLRELPEKTRDIFLQAQFDGMGYADIAKLHNTSLITVKRHMRKAFAACLAAA
ncbi:sigma-70 family RNA polymerase sigma factor [Variovorax sp. ZT4R33]|uniref:sigma-70 family RNA polymerase sigma factor n=1 Tax=Variovorax sp. ZT4R33 TaxID=3443743 RepID=UPI003F45A1C5